jgi:hypothetical protein
VCGNRFRNSKVCFIRCGKVFRCYQRFL